MNKLYGFISLALGASSTLIIIILNTKKILNGQFVIGDAATLLLFSLFISLFFYRSWRVFKNIVEIESSDSVIKKVLFYIGLILIIASTILFIITLIIVIQILLTKADGVPIGIGVGAILFTYLTGALLIEVCKKTHIKPIQ